ncbi:uncharacterized protein VICG_00926 [Vittaforma corneae ATCC 50505]|uniref:Coatomer subunit beta n=1 Tax=Vittaforma corneae (strain ATCC 50505) TaxID=993615 RepID=L2GP30_VITCO|nr:uncharacterized protein VICG_00926 [Vittaforma corneae ATCC 50505]ELA42077.1 hypothetical protein VICG_00926 [Vittaforma corneae ATCC 50505]
MKKESVSQVLIVGFDVMHKLGMGFEEFLEIDYPREILEVLVEKNEDGGFLKHMVNSKFNTVSFYASCKLLSKGHGQKPTIDNVVRILESATDLKQDFLPYLKFIDTSSFELLNLIDAYDYEFSSQVIDVVFKNADASEFMRIAEFLHQKYIETGMTSDKKKAFKILLLEKMAVFASTHCVYVDELVSSCLKNALDADPEIMYASLSFLNTCVSKDRFKKLIHDFLLENFSKLKYGKIIRRAFDILSLDISKENYERLLDSLLNDLNSLRAHNGSNAKQLDLCEMSSVAAVSDAESLALSNQSALAGQHAVPFYLSKQTEVFVGAHIALCLVGSYRDEWGLSIKTVGTLLRIIEVGDLQNILDMSSKSTIIACVRSLINGKKQKRSISEQSADYANVNVLKPVEFSLLTTPLAFKKFGWTDPLTSDQFTVQLSGLGDPLYIEANCAHCKYEISLDLLVVNQTSSYLQNISIDFNFSKNIQMISAVPPFSLQPDSATTIQAQFSIHESFSSFVTATVTFKYPRKDDYSGRPYVQNLSEISFDVNELLEGAEVDFKDQWRNLEWENIYSISIRKSCDGLLQKISERINGHLCGKFEYLESVVGNIACYTIQKSLVLVNVCISSGSSSLVEIRVRSKSEELVKSISGLLSQFLKSQQ